MPIYITVYGINKTDDRFEVFASYTILIFISLVSH